MENNIIKTTILTGDDEGGLVDYNGVLCAAYSTDEELIKGIGSDLLVECRQLRDDSDKASYGYKIECKISLVTTDPFRSK